MLRFNPYTQALGFIPEMLSESDPRPAKEQLDTGYRHGGGWNPFKGFELMPDKSIAYPGDPTIKPLSSAKLRDEEIYVYPYAWVMILQPSGEYEIARMD